MARELSPLQKAYADFFFAKLADFNVDTPASLDADKKTEFFNSIKKDWKTEKVELAKQGVHPVTEDLSIEEKAAIGEHIIRSKTRIVKIIMQESKQYIEEEKSLQDMIKSATEYKKQLSDLKREASKNKSETNKAKVAAKEEQLRRVAKAIMAARAAEHDNK